MADGSTTQLIARLERIRSEFSNSATTEKLHLLRSINERSIRSAALVRRLHSVLCYLCAFPDDDRVDRLAADELAWLSSSIPTLSKQQKKLLANSGLAHTQVSCDFSYDIARWISRHGGADVEIDWDRFVEPDRLDDLLVHVLSAAELEAFESGELSTAEWIRLAKGQRRMSDLVWLVHQIETAPTRLNGFVTQLYDNCEVPLCWRLPESVDTVDCHRARSTSTRRLRRPAANIIAQIKRPLKTVRRVGAPRSRDLIDQARLALARRCREVHAFTYANADEVYVADFGQRADLVLFGVTCRQRLSLEANYGYVLRSNGLVIGYGGVSPVFAQANTGINIFEEFRRSEAGYLFVQTLRTFHTLFGSTRFIVNAYQFGDDNDEAIASGAFWFYYKLGFRPVDPACRRQADREFARLRKKQKSRTNQRTLQKLARGNLLLSLPAPRAQQLYLDEAWLGVISRKTTELIARHPCDNRAQAIRKIASSIAGDLNVHNRAAWPPDERDAFVRMAPIVSLVDNLAQWRRADKRALVRLMRAKGKPRERGYAQLLGRNIHLYEALVCLAEAQS